MDSAQKLQGVFDSLMSNERYVPVVQEIARELHDGFETILCEALINQPGQAIDGAAILAILMQWTSSLTTHQPHNPIVPPMKGLPSTRYGNPSP